MEKGKTAQEEKKKYSLQNTAPLSVSEPEILYAVRQNKVTTSYLTDLKRISSLTDDALSTALNISLKTFRNYKENTDQAMKPHLQEHVYTLLALYHHGIEVFGSDQKFNEWLQKPNFFFDNEKPIEFFTTIGGIMHIDNRLAAIQYGDNV